ncbi:retrotransposon-related protein [Tanacetum coccineum]
MDEQTVRGWLNDLLDRFDNVLQDRLDTLFETLAQKRAAVFQQQSDAFEALFGDKNSQVVDTIAGDQEDPNVKDKQENQDDLNIAVPDQVLEKSILHTSDKVEETDLTSPDMVVAEDLGKKHLHDFDETAMLLMTDKDDDPGEAATDGGDDGFKWGVQEASAFEKLKNRLSTTPVLSLSDFNDVFLVKADASANGIGTEGQPLKEPIAIHDWRVVLTAMQRRIWDPGINISSRQHLEGKVIMKEWGMIHQRFKIIS